MSSVAHLAREPPRHEVPRGEQPARRARAARARGARATPPWPPPSPRRARRRCGVARSSRAVVPERIGHERQRLGSPARRSDHSERRPERRAVGGHRHEGLAGRREADRLDRSEHRRARRRRCRARRPGRLARRRPPRATTTPGPARPGCRPVGALPARSGPRRPDRRAPQTTTLVTLVPRSTVRITPGRCPPPGEPRRARPRPPGGHRGRVGVLVTRRARPPTRRRRRP